MRRITLSVAWMPSVLAFALSSCGGNAGADPPAPPPGRPAVVTIAATEVGATGATLNALVNPNGLATGAWFEWGTSSSLAAFDTSSTQAVGDGTSPRNVTEGLAGLSPETTYYYRVAASSSAGGTSGSIATFTTAAASVFGVVATDPAGGATGIPLGSVITVTFSRDVEPASLVGAITVSSSSGDLPGVTSYNATTRTATFAPTAPLAPLTVYTVTIAAKVKSVDTVRLSAPYVFAFESGCAS